MVFTERTFKQSPNEIDLTNYWLLYTSQWTKPIPYQNCLIYDKIINKYVRQQLTTAAILHVPDQGQTHIYWGGLKHVCEHSNLP